MNAQTPEPILFGTYLASSYHPEITYHRFNDSNLVKIGFNTIIQTVMHPVIHNKLFTTEPSKWHDNRIPLGSSSFSNIVALNSYWNKEDDQQVDWVKILTHGAYNKWEVEGGNVFQSNIIKMVRDEMHTTKFISDGVVGILILEPGSTLNLDSASSVYCAGDLYINGTETNKVTINFLQPNETKQNSIYLGNGSSAIVKYAQIRNGYSGISALNGFDTLIIDNCNFTNINNAALLLNGTGYDIAKITNNTYTNCDYAGFFSNLSNVVINSDSANTTSGYYFSGIEYALPKDGLVSIKLYDITGRLVKQLVNEQKPMGRHRTTIESGNLASGIYIYSLRVNDININKKLVILK